MRIAKVLETLLGITGIVVESAEAGSNRVVFDVRLRRKKPRCSGCRKRAPGYDPSEAREWRHLNVGATLIWLRYAPRRVECRRCGILNEQVPWGNAGGWFSAAFEETTTYLAQVADKTSVTKIMGIAWVTVGRIIERVVSERLDSSRLNNLAFIGMDDFSYRKRHRYVTIVVDHVTGRVVWAAKGRSGETLAAFFKKLGPERARQIEVVTMDMAAGYIKVVEKHLPPRLRPFLRVARTIRKYRKRILAYVDFRLTNGPVEGINNRIRSVARRAFGFHSAQALISMTFLCCSKIDLTPALPGFSHPLAV